MSDVSIGRIRLPRAAHRGMTAHLARGAVLRLLGRLEIGSLAVHEGPVRHHFGAVARDGGPCAEVHVHDPAVYTMMLRGGAIAAGESYMRGYWSSPDLLQVTRLFCANMAILGQFDASQSLVVRLALRLAHMFRRNSRAGSRDNIAAHYDLGNDFFRLFLDPTMMYSSAVFEDRHATLETASTAKLDALCRQLELSADDHLLEIGTGWGGLALHAAKHYGCRVTTTTISREQFDFASQRVREEGLEQRITLLCEDYRNLHGRFDKLVSVEMIEAVGHEYYADYFRKCSGLLREDGKMVVQAITVPDQRYAQARDAVDFIKRYIFPGGCLPSLAVISHHLASATDLQMVHLRDITQDYAITLSHWRERFLARLDAVRAQGFGDEFIRMWEYYLCYCEGGFRERVIGTVQLAFAKPGYRPGSN